MSTQKKYYWLKLKRDFFKRHDIKIIEGMDNGKDYVLFYMKLLLEGIDHEGHLRFSETVPYNDKMLATITDTNIDIVRSAVKIFSELGMMEQFDDGTLFMKQVQEMLGDETEWAKKKREYREKQKKLGTPEGHEKDNVRQELDIELEIDIELDKEIDILPDKPARSTFQKPSLSEVSQYCRERKNNVDASRFIDHYESKGWVVGKTKMKDWQAAVRNWERNDFNNQNQKDAQIKKKLDDRVMLDI
jgi:predicted phage replisome organizer